MSQRSCFALREPDAQALRSTGELSRIGNVIVTQTTREMIEASGLKKPMWKPVIKQHIVDLDWTAWDRSSPTPLVYPPQSEPAGYVLEGSHSTTVAQAMPDLWEIEAEKVGKGWQKRIRHRNSVITLTLEAEPPDFFRTNGLRHMFVSERAANWLQLNLGAWVALRPVSMAEPV